MTRQEQTNERNLDMSRWIRTHLPDSSTGTRVTDIDFVITNANSNTILFVEVKTRNAQMKAWQKQIYSRIISSINRSGAMKASFAGIRFEHTFFHDGRVWLNGVQSSEQEIKKTLSEYA